ncbi:hypothetical protein [Parasulfitobacter algicola]|uniref:Glycosyl transferase family 2 n=1 Tax=Parasulfitobacter algicola TaxID=2614809 RepID=A0ABX2IPQ1_9RHOB|nr:hypothetical protein [Sulfitobacter algicola]NSX54871.1 hypothetical protein [Sulfitobacter algicola]
MTRSKTYPTLASCSAAGSGLARESDVPKAFWGPNYEAEFDHDTLWYDAIGMADRVRLVCPKLLNLEAIFKTGQVFVDGWPVRPRIRRYRRHDLVDLPWKGPKPEIEVRYGDWVGQSMVNPAVPDRLAGLNVHVAISKNNDLQWLADFARFHIQHHDLQAMVLMDNGSDRYGLDEIGAVLRQTGLQDVIVLDVPFPYGPRGVKKMKRKNKYLQTAMLNALRFRFLGQARAVLQCDIDELVWAGGKSVFDAAVAHPLGYVQFPGEWRYPKDGTRHGAHRYRLEGRDGCPTKYCIVPGGPMRRFSWDIHRLERLAFGQFLTSKRAEYWHCAGISTNWKGWNRLNNQDKANLDPVADQALKAVDWT